MSWHSIVITAIGLKYKCKALTKAIAFVMVCVRLEWNVRGRRLEGKCAGLIATAAIQKSLLPPTSATSMFREPEGCNGTTGIGYSVFRTLEFCSIKMLQKSLRHSNLLFVS